MIRSYDGKKIVAGLLLAVFCVTALTGCASLRKKFTRTKKGPSKDEEFIPVLQPVEYEKVVESPAQGYRNHYAMVKVYFKDLWDILGRPEGGEKREKYIINEIVSHVEGMTALLTGTAKDAAQALRARLGQVVQAYDKPAGLRRYDVITGDIRGIEREIYRKFKPDAVAGALTR